MKIKKSKLVSLIEMYLHEQQEFADEPAGDIGNAIDFASGLSEFIKINESKLNLSGVSAEDINKMINSNGELLFNGKNLIWEGTQFSANSGAGEKNSLQTSGKETIENSKLKNQGPTPPGKYSLGETQGPSDKTWAGTARAIAGFIKTLGETGPGAQFRSKFSSFAWGSFRAPLNPHSDTETFGRDNMYLHGGSNVGSIGCIDVLNNDVIIFAITDAWKDKNPGGVITIEVAY